MEIKTIIMFLFLFCACRPSTKTGDVKLDNNGDTLEVKKRYSNHSIREIISYQGNKPFSNIGFTEKGDTIKLPTACLTESNDSLFVFIPRNKYAKISLDIDNDSSRIVAGVPIQYRLTGLLNSVMLPIESKMFTSKGTIYGTVSCRDSTGFCHYYVFLSRTKMQAN